MQLILTSLDCCIDDCLQTSLNGQKSKRRLNAKLTSSAPMMDAVNRFFGGQERTQRPALAIHCGRKFSLELMQRLTLGKSIHCIGYPAISAIALAGKHVQGRGINAGVTFSMERLPWYDINWQFAVQVNLATISTSPSCAS
jgi:hypothetical protein